MDESVPPELLRRMGRWLGEGEGEWAAPMQGPPGREGTEDLEALTLLVVLTHEAICRLGADPAGFAGIPDAAAQAAASCDALGKDQEATRALANAGRETLPPQDELPPVLNAALLPLPAFSVTLHGQTLHFRFIHPDLVALVRDLGAAPAPTGLLGAVRTTAWIPGTPATTIDGDLAAIETAAEQTIARWKTSLDGLAVEAAGRAAALRWVRTAVYEAAGAAVLDTDPGAALVLLEEAAGGVARPRPGPGRDPVLLARVAMARWRAGEHRRAAQVLRDIGTQPGWEFAGVGAEMAARVAVLPSATESRVRR